MGKQIRLCKESRTTTLIIVPHVTGVQGLGSGLGFWSSGCGVLDLDFRIYGRS